MPSRAVLRALPNIISSSRVVLAAAFVAFRSADVDVQIIEVGLGGLLDSTNVFGDSTSSSVPPEPHDAPSPHVVVITPISLEHTAILGDTIPAIAAQKAAIITPGSTVVAASLLP